MIRMGILDFDTSHVTEFTKRINHIDIAEDQWVDGARIVLGCAGQSTIAPHRIDEYRTQMIDYGIPLVAQPDEMIGKIDAVLVESLAGDPHLEQVRPFLEARIPAFVDKPFSCNLNDAIEMARLSKLYKTPIMSASSLRFAPEVVIAADNLPSKESIHGAFVFGPAPLDPGNPGLFHYGIHSVEMLYTFMGTGCKWVSSRKTEHQPEDRTTEVVTGLWEDGRIATLRALRDGPYQFGFTLFGQNVIHSETISTRNLYRELLKQIVKMFETNQVPVAIEETLEILAFMEAALISARRDGSPITLNHKNI